MKTSSEFDQTGWGDRGVTMRKNALSLLLIGQAAALLAAGFAVLWFSQDLMTWLIHEVGEERALGSENVVRLENGGALLTNPGAMVLWSIPIWLLGWLQITAAASLVGLGFVRPRLRDKPATQVREGDGRR